MPRILINGRFLTQPITGVQRYALEIVREFDRLLDEGHPAAAGLTLEVAHPRQGVLHDLPLARIARTPVGRLRGHAWEQFELPARQGHDLLFCPGNLAPLRPLWDGTRVVTTVHDLSYLYHPEAYSRWFNLGYQTLMPQVLARSAAVITVSEAERAAMLRHYPRVAKRLFAVQNGVRLPAAPPAEPPPLPQPYLLYVGSLSARKNIQGFLAAAQRLMRERPELRAAVVGASGASFSQVNLRPASDLEPRFHFFGQVNDGSKLAALYRHAACLVFPSFYEASPLPPVEAMSLGCPVAAGDIPSLRERCGPAACYVDPHHVDAIAAGVREILEDEALRRRLIDAGHERARFFTWRRCALATLDVIRSALPASKLRRAA